MLPFATKIREWFLYGLSAVIGLFWLVRTLEKRGEDRKQGEWERKSLEHSNEVYEKAAKARNNFKSSNSDGGRFLSERGFIRDD